MEIVVLLKCFLKTLINNYYIELHTAIWKSFRVKVETVNFIQRSNVFMKNCMATKKAEDFVFGLWDLSPTNFPVDVIFVKQLELKPSQHPEACVKSALPARKYGSCTSTAMWWQFIIMQDGLYHYIDWFLFFLFCSWRSWSRKIIFCTSPPRRHTSPMCERMLLTASSPSLMLTP